MFTCASLRRSRSTGKIVPVPLLWPVNGYLLSKANSKERIIVTAKTTNPASRRKGFTLIELLIVIAVITILAALLVPTVGGAIKRARIAGVVTEINQLESAIAKFKADHGIEPPSSITLSETGNGWTSNSAALIRQIWPQYDFGNHDINGDGDTTDTFILSQGECLVFFLGGLNSTNLPGNIGACIGFSKNPANPFARGGNREAWLFEFIPARFTDIDTTPDGFPEYRDALPTQTMPYLYYSSYDGQGYDETNEFGSGGLTKAYRQDNNFTTNTFWKPNSHQLISPGYDKQYGFGGAYITSGTDRLPAATSGSPTSAERIPEADNITNFSNGQLQP